MSEKRKICDGGLYMTELFLIFVPYPALIAGRSLLPETEAQEFITMATRNYISQCGTIVGSVVATSCKSIIYTGGG